MEVHKKTCCTTLTRYPDSVQTNLCSYLLIQHGSHRRSKYSNVIVFDLTRPKYKPQPNDLYARTLTITPNDKKSSCLNMINVYTLDYYFTITHIKLLNPLHFGRLSCFIIWSVKYAFQMSEWLLSECQFFSYIMTRTS